MKKLPITARTLLTSTMTQVLTLLSVLVLFFILDHRNRDRIISERNQLEVNSVQLVINDSYTLGDLIGLRKYLDTFANINHWESGSLIDSMGSEIWKQSPRPLPGAVRTEIKAEIRTATGGRLGTLSIVKNQTYELEKWDEQRDLSTWGLIGITILVLLLQTLTLLRILRPVSDLSMDIQREARLLNLQLAGGNSDDELYLIKRWFSEVARSWQEEKERAARESEFKAMGILAAQVSHDIRSPLTALLSAIQSATGVDELTRVQIRSAVNRIKDIANNLLTREKGRSTDEAPAMAEPVGIEHLPALIESSLSQKRIQYRDRPDIEIQFSMDPSAFGAFASLQSTEFHRVISNLINNSVEAIKADGRITVNLRIHNGQIEMTVSDSGHGIPAELLSKVVERGGTFGKRDGHGLGLSHAKESVLRWGGSLTISSEVDHGTIVALTLPSTPPPSWFAHALTIDGISAVVILDDDPGIHNLWVSRIHGACPDLSIFHCYKSEDLLAWYRASVGNHDRILYLCDYELLGSKHNGLEVIEMLGIEQEAILVSSRSEEIHIRERCERRRIRLLPKPLAPWIPIYNTKPADS